MCYVLKNKIDYSINIHLYDHFSETSLEPKILILCVKLNSHCLLQLFEKILISNLRCLFHTFMKYGISNFLRTWLISIWTRQRISMHYWNSKYDIELDVHPNKKESNNLQTHKSDTWIIQLIEFDCMTPV